MSTHELVPGPYRRRSARQRRARQPPARRWRAARIARLLLPASAAVGGFVSTEVAVTMVGGRLAWPEVALACREPPADGRLDRPPELVVVLQAAPQAAEEAARWLEAGAWSVWCVGDTAVQECSAACTVTRTAGEWATVDGLQAVRVPVAALLT